MEGTLPGTQAGEKGKLGEMLFKPGQSLKILLRNHKQRFQKPAVNKEERKGIFQRQQQPPMATKQGINRHFCSVTV